MSKHPTNLFGVPPQALGEALAGMRYDALRDVIFSLMCQLNNDSKADAARARPKLSDALERGAMAMGLAHYHLVEAWKICERYMVQEKTQANLLQALAPFEGREATVATMQEMGKAVAEAFAKECAVCQVTADLTADLNGVHFCPEHAMHHGTW